uniref:ZP domain-containing protein n=1 Tax=Caenorhabditis japonica TaxID=281687 RepID=A0A8R1ICN8_CAEJA
MSDNCHYVYQSKDLHSCVISRRRKALPLLVQRMCVDVGDFPDGSAVLFDELGGCQGEEGHLVGKDLELHQCMQLCATHPTRSCESISYTKSRTCYLHDKAVKPDERNSNCSIFTLNVITFQTEVSSKKLHIKESSQKSAPLDLKINTQCNFGHISVHVSSEGLAGGEIYVRNGHTNCSTMINPRGEATLKISHNETACPITKNGDVYETVVVVTQTLGNATVITIDDQLFKVRCDYTNQKKAVAVAKTMNLRTTKFNELDIFGKVNVKPMSMELRGKREIIKSQTVKLGQTVDLVFTAENSTSARNVFIRHCTALDQIGEEKIVLIQNGCATQNAKEYVLRDEIRETATGFVLPFRAFRFKKGDAVRIECEVKYCEQCQKPNCSARNRRFVDDAQFSTAENVEEVQAELLVQTAQSQSLELDGYCLGQVQWILLSVISAILISSQLIVLIYLCLKSRKF